MGQTPCANPQCTNPVEQLPGSHRQRRYCSDACRQSLYRIRTEAKQEQVVRERWANFSLETQQGLEAMLSKYGPTFAEGIVAVIQRERSPHVGPIRPTYFGCNKLWYCQETVQLLTQIAASDTHLAYLVADTMGRECGVQWKAIASLPQAGKQEDEQRSQLNEMQKALIQAKNDLWQREKQLEILAQNLERSHRYGEASIAENLELKSRLEALERSLQEGEVTEQQLARDFNAVCINAAGKELLSTPYGQALLLAKERELEVQHLKTRIEKQYERRIRKQQSRIEALEKALSQAQQHRASAVS